MGTRADFYIGIGKDAEWLGSTAWDGYPDSFAKIIAMKSEKGFRAAVAKMLAERDDASIAGTHGWPWPWEDSGTTDYAYAFDGEKGVICEFGHGWYTLKQWETLNKAQGADEPNAARIKKLTKPKRDDLPDMSKKQDVTLGKRSGVMVFAVPKVDR